MKRLSLLVLLATCTILAGCVKYRVTLTNGQSFTVLGKPKLDKEQNIYHYKSGGQDQYVSRGRVVSIEPASDDAESTFKSSGHLRRRATKCSTYFPRMSASRFTASPTLRSPNAVTS